eukprot:60811-Chlamydomonas_euryale.AAC.3
MPVEPSSDLTWHSPIALLCQTIQFLLLCIPYPPPPFAVRVGVAGKARGQLQHRLRSRTQPAGAATH